MNNPLRDIINLLFPPQCIICGAVLPDGMPDICSECRIEIPLTEYWNSRTNPVSEMFAGHFPVETASAYFFYINYGRWRDLIHTFKYRNGWRMARLLGEWYGEAFRQSGNYDDVDVIVPIPLHPLKKLKRGYNQSEYIAQGIAAKLERPLETRAIRRHTNNRSQARQHHSERWRNVEGIFDVKNIRLLAGRHVLLVDDVLTTGATITSCAETIVRSVPDVRISIVTLACVANSRTEHIASAHVD